MFNINKCKHEKIWRLQPTTVTVITRVLMFAFINMSWQKQQIK